MRINYVMIDLENVQVTALSGLDNESFRVLVFVGSNQAKISFDLVCEMQKLGEKAKYIKIEGNGSNALDFHIAYYIGKIASEDNGSCFYIISKDAGFDPLIQHLNKHHVDVKRMDCIDDIGLLKVINAKNLDEKVNTVISSLKSRGQSKPKTVKTLISTIYNIFNKNISDREIDLILKALRGAKLIIMSGDNIAYCLNTFDSR